MTKGFEHRHLDLAQTLRAGDGSIVSDIAHIMEKTKRDFSIGGPDGESIQGLVVPEGFVAHIIDPETLSNQPTRHRGTATFHESRSFSTFVNKHQTPGSQLYVDIELAEDLTFKSPFVKCVFNPHTADVAGWGDFGAKLHLRPTVEWLAWTRVHGQQMSQVAFAEFIEDHLLDVREPAHGEMLDIARTFDANQNSTFKQATTLESGDVSFEWSRDTQATARSGNANVAIPKIIKIGLAPFDGAPPYGVDVRLRYRVIENVGLRITLMILRGHKVIESAINDVMEEITTATGLTPLHGRPIDKPGKTEPLTLTTIRG